MTLFVFGYFIKILTATPLEASSNTLIFPIRETHLEALLDG